MNHLKYSLRLNKRLSKRLASKRLCIQTAVNQFPLSWIKPIANERIIVCQQVPSLSDVTFYVRLHTLLHVVGSCCAKFETLLLALYRVTRKAGDNFVHSLVEHEARQSMMFESRVDV